MIYTCTLNPSVDYVVHVKEFDLGGLNRTSFDTKHPGGKGINVSRVLHRLGLESTALGYTGGFTGQYIKDILEQEGTKTAFVEVNEDTRINIKLKANEETEINGQGPTLTEENLQALYQQFSSLEEGDFVVLAGSIPSSAPKDIYVTLTKLARKKGARVVVDTSGKDLLDIVKEGPFFIKPNHHELGELFDVSIQTAEEAVPYARKLMDMGAENVIVSMAGQGSLLVTKDNVYRANVPKGELKNSVGAGDSLVAGFLASYVKDGDFAKALQVGAATGSATAFSIELCTKDHMESLLPQIHVTGMDE